MILLATSSLKWYGLSRIFELAKETKFEWIHIDMDFDDYDTLDAKYMLELSKKYSLPIVSMSSPWKWMTTLKLRSLLKGIYEVKPTNFFVSPPHRTDKDFSWFTVKFKSFANEIEWHWIDFGVTNVEPKTFLFFLPEYKEANLIQIKKLTEKTGLVTDAIDITSWVDLIRTYVIFWKTIKAIFLADRKWNTTWLFPWKWELPLESILIKQKRSKFKKDIILKVKPESLKIWNSKEVVRYLMASKEFIERYSK